MARAKLTAYGSTGFRVLVLVVIVVAVAASGSGSGAVFDKVSRNGV